MSLLYLTLHGGNGLARFISRVIFWGRYYICPRGCIVGMVLKSRVSGFFGAGLSYPRESSDVHGRVRTVRVRFVFGNEGWSGVLCVGCRDRLGYSV